VNNPDRKMRKFETSITSHMRRDLIHRRCTLNPAEEGAPFQRVLSSALMDNARHWS
jgi:hypothetical protein